LEVNIASSQGRSLLGRTLLLAVASCLGGCANDLSLRAQA
jgi:hypothetical protein